MKKYLRVLVCLLGVLSGIKAEAASPKILSATVLSGQWQITEIQGTALPEAENLFMLNLDCLKKTVSGFTGCNYVHGNFKFKAGKQSIVFPDLASTRRSCPLPETEIELLEILKRVEHYSFFQDKAQGSRLELRDADGNTLLMLQKMMPIDGSWTISKFEGKAVNEAENLKIIFNSSQNSVKAVAECSAYHARLEPNPQKPSVFKITDGNTLVGVCPQTDREKEIFSAIEKICSYRIFSSRKAILCNSAGEVLLELSR